MSIRSTPGVAGAAISAALLCMAGLASDASLAARGGASACIIETGDADTEGSAAVGATNKLAQGPFQGSRQPAMGGPRAGGKRRPAGAASEPLTMPSTVYEIIDTHVHIGFGPREHNFRAGISEALSKLDHRHVALAILLPTPQLGTTDNKYDVDDLQHETRSKRFRFVGGSGVFARFLHSRSWASDDEAKEFRALARSLVDKGIVGFGEIGLFHYGTRWAGNVFGSIPLDHPLLDVLTDVAAKADIPIDVHFDVVPKDTPLPKPLQGAGNPDFLKANLAQFDQFLTRHKTTRIVWAHVGFEVAPFRTPKLCTTLLQRHENLYMSIRMVHGGPKPSIALDKNGTLKPEWKRVFTTFPDRFVFGGESMYGSSQSKRYDAEFVLYQKLLAQLPAPIARQIASENARAIYRLGPTE